MQTARWSPASRGGTAVTVPHAGRSVPHLTPCLWDLTQTPRSELHPASSTSENKLLQRKGQNPRHPCALHSKQELACHLKLRTKSQATEQKTKLFSAVTLLNLIFPMSSFSFSSRMKCIFVLCHKTLDFVKAIHFSMVICKCTPYHTRSGEFYGFFQRQGK